jgi:hypothetical protein
MSLDPLLIREKLFKGIDSDYNVVDIGIVSEVIQELENYNITKEALEATRLGKHINEVRRKSNDRLLADRAKSLVKKWRSLLSESGPPPGGGGGPRGGVGAGRGGENNNSVAATNGNTLGSRINSAVSPGLRSNLSPGLRNNLSPGLRNNLSPAMRSNLSPGLRSNLSPGLRTAMSPAGHHMRPGSIPNSLSGGMRSVRGSPSLGRSTPRVSPATVTLSSGESSPAGSRPTSPQQPFVPINPMPVNSLPNSRSPSPDIEIVEEIVKAPPPTPTPITKKRMRGSDENDIGNGTGVRGHVREMEAKRPRLDYSAAAAGGLVGNSVVNSSPVIAQNGLDRSHRDGREAGSDNTTTPTTPLASRKVSKNESDMLKAQISRAKRSGKVKTTKELIENLGIDSGGVGLVDPALALAAAQAAKSVTSLVPDENKEQLMNRFFSSQSQIPAKAAVAGDSVRNAVVAATVIEDEDEITEIREDEEEDDVIEVLSRPGTGIGSRSRHSQLKSGSNSQVSSRINTPAPHTAAANPEKQSVEDILRKLEPFDAVAVLAEWEERLLQDQQEEDIPGLIPVYKPKLEITEDLVSELNNGELQYIGGLKF